MTETVSRCAPILLIGFNRPDYMAAQINAIKAAKPNRLYIAVDGPRADRQGEAELCWQVRDCIKLVDWPCEMKTLFREKNLGCKYGVSGAITWFFANEPEGIVLEDDCRPTQDFLRFASEMLERYREDKRIGAICGFNFFNLQTDKNVSYHFSRHMDVWGWASWRRVWNDYDIDVANSPDRLVSILGKATTTAYYKRFYRTVALDVGRGLSTWDIQLSLLFIDKGYLSVVPKERLVANIGLADKRATHTGGYVYWGEEWSKSSSIEFPLVEPDDEHCDEKADCLRERMEGAILPRGLTWVGAKCPLLCGCLSLCGNALKRIAPVLFRL